ncbi:unnamed protein product, partial [Didymodactylos carnosus]
GGGAPPAVVDQAGAAARDNVGVARQRGQPACEGPRGAWHYEQRRPRRHARDSRRAVEDEYSGRVRGRRHA